MFAEYKFQQCLFTLTTLGDGGLNKFVLSSISKDRIQPVNIIELYYQKIAQTSLNLNKRLVIYNYFQELPIQVRQQFSPTSLGV